MQQFEEIQHSQYSIVLGAGGYGILGVFRTRRYDALDGCQHRRGSRFERANRC
jgi:hypothetical protein